MYIYKTFEKQSKERKRKFDFFFFVSFFSGFVFLVLKSFLFLIIIVVIISINTIAVPSTIHCDHLIVARDGSKADTERAKEDNREVYDFMASAGNLILSFFILLVLVRG